MKIKLWHPWISPFEEIDRWFDEDWLRFPKVFAEEGKFVPEMDVSETENEIVVETALPGVEPNKVNVTVEDNLLTVEGSSQKKIEEKKRGYWRKEISSGSFYRQVRLPQSVEKDKAKAEWENGVLKVSIPKVKLAPKGKKVAIKVKTK